jgi:hypothetical protein
MTDTTKEFISAMTLIRQGARGKSEEFRIATGKYQARLKKWQIKLINSTILLSLIALITLLIYSIF